jgi:hypothetical protein
MKLPRFTLRELFLLVALVAVGSVASADTSVQVSGDAVVFFGFDEKMLDKLIADNDLEAVTEWQVYGETGYQNFHQPKPLKDRAAADAKWPGQQLRKYRIYPKVTEAGGQEHVHYFFYHAEAQTLVIIHQRRSN